MLQLSVYVQEHFPADPDVLDPILVCEHTANNLLPPCRRSCVAPHFHAALVCSLHIHVMLLWQKTPIGPFCKSCNVSVTLQIVYLCKGFARSKLWKLGRTFFFYAREATSINSHDAVRTMVLVRALCANGDRTVSRIDSKYQSEAGLH